MLQIFPDAPTWQWALSLLIIGMVGLSYYVNCAREGRTIDFYHGWLVIQFLLPFFVISLFAYDSRNERTIGANFDATLATMKEAFMVTFVGSAIVIVLSNRILDRALGRHNTFLRLNVRLMADITAPKTAVVLGVLTVVAMLLTELALVIFFGASPFDIRGTSLSQGSVRPFFNLFVVSLGPLALISSSVAWLTCRRKRFLLLCCTIGILESVSGSRQSLIDPILLVGLIYIESLRGRVRVTTLIASMGLMLAAGTALGLVRGAASGSFINPESRGATAMEDILYGSNFSDVRDFAWLLSRWDREEVHGRTYAAAILGFVPRTLLPYREEYALSTYCNRFLGFDTDTHAGLRPGLFGESYINFGWLGVIAASTFYGLVLGHIRSRIDKRRDAGQLDLRSLVAELGPLQLSSRVMITAGFWGYYVFVATGLACRWLSTILPNSRKKAARRHPIKCQKHSRRSLSTADSLTTE